MSPEQAAAFINAQTMMLHVELAELRAKYASIALDANGQVITVIDATPVAALTALREHYEHVLGYNAVLNIYQEAARYG